MVTSSAHWFSLLQTSWVDRVKGFETGKRTQGVTNVSSELIIPSSSLDFLARGSLWKQVYTRKLCNTLTWSHSGVSYPAELRDRDSGRRLGCKGRKWTADGWAVCFMEDLKTKKRIGPNNVCGVIMYAHTFAVRRTARPLWHVLCVHW